MDGAVGRRMATHPLKERAMEAGGTEVPGPAAAAWALKLAPPLPGTSF